jgi:hypothetical protein
MLGDVLDQRSGNPELEQEAEAGHRSKQDPHAVFRGPDCVHDDWRDDDHAEHDQDLARQVGDRAQRESVGCAMALVHVRRLGVGGAWGPVIMQDCAAEKS